MSDLYVSSLYVHPQIKALVSLTRGEGYGLPILEAAASGLPIIATGWSGHTDFLKHGKYIDVSYSLKEIHGSRVDNKIFMKGSKWAEANEEDFKKKVKKFKENYLIPREWATELKKEILGRYSKEKIEECYDKHFESII
jgi:glycosyltransferase involved in cell wall biosynthesis